MQPEIRPSDTWLGWVLGEFGFKATWAWNGRIFYDAAPVFKSLHVPYRVAHVFKSTSDKQHVFHYEGRVYLTDVGIVLFAFRANVRPLVERFIACLQAPIVPPPMTMSHLLLLAQWQWALQQQQLQQSLQQPQMPTYEEKFPWTSDPAPMDEHV